jgi:DNA-binding GntR family transcriptional regulator
MTLLSDRVHHELKRRLTLWEYLPGTRMGEEALAAEFGVSRTPVRDALRRLAQEGFLEDTEGWTGYRVRKPDLPRIEELYEVRLSLEQTAVRRLAAAPPDAEIDELLKMWRRPKGSNPAPDPDMVHADEAFHETLARLAGNKTLFTMLCSIDEHIRVIRTNDFLTPRRISQTYRQHRGILLAVRKGDPDLAVERLSAHIHESRTFVAQAAARALTRILARDTEQAAPISASAGAGKERP